MSIRATTILPTAHGEFKVNYHNFDFGSGVSFSVGDLTQENTLVRLHSSCLFTESFHSKLCDCELQLSTSLQLIANENQGVVVYTYEEGRGVGLENKIRALEVERTEGLDTVDAYKKLGFKPDPRDYKVAVSILKDLQVGNKIRLITNNPRKQKGVEEGGFEVSELVALTYPMTERLRKYLRVKKDKLGHRISPSLLEK